MTANKWAENCAPTAYGGLLMLVLLSKFEGNYTFNATTGCLHSKPDVLNSY